MKNNVAFLTGLPHHIAIKFLEKMLKEEHFIKIYTLVRKEFTRKIRGYINKNLSVAQSSRIEIIEGDIRSIDLGLSGEEYKKIVSEVNYIYHIASRYFYGMDEDMAYNSNVIGTENMIEFALNVKKLKRFSFYSTVFVSGDIQGVIYEDQLVKPKNFHNHYEYTKYEAEKRVKKYLNLIPISIFRPSIIVGDLGDERIDSFKGPYYLMKLLSYSHLPLPLPRKGETKINIVPVNYVVDTIYHLSLNSLAEGKTFHIVDPKSRKIKDIYNILSQKIGKKGSSPLLGKLSSLTLKTIFKVPFIEKMFPSEKAAFDFLYYDKVYDQKNLKDLLNGGHSNCPPFENYVDDIISFWRSLENEKKGKKPFLTPDEI